MDARYYRAALLAVLVCVSTTAVAQGASYRTKFFVVTAPTAELAKQVGDAAEAYRRKLAQDWLGYELPDWADVCPIYVTPRGGAGGETRFAFIQGHPRQWKMTIQGPPDRILDSVLPHEVLHMVFATHFKQGLPRWADEGACTTVEHSSEREKQDRLLYQCLTTDRGIAFNQMFAMREYPKDMLPLYAQGYSVARFLIAVGGKRKFIEFVGEGLKTNNWTAATKRAFGFESLSQLQVNWLEWVRQGGREELAAKHFVNQDQVAAQETKQPPAQLAALESGATARAAKTALASTSATGAAGDRSPNSAPGRLTPIPSGATPSVNQVSSGGSGGSWYAKQRDVHRSSSGSQAPDRAVSRPQPVEQAKEVVVEWSHNSPYTPGSTRR